MNNEVNSDEHGSDDRHSNQDGSGSGEIYWTLVRGLTCLVLVQVALLVVVVPVAILFGVKAQIALIAWAVCCVATLAAHVAAEFPKGMEYVLLRLVAGMACRTIPPLLLAVWGIYYSQPPLGKPIVLLLVVFYMAGLAADSIISVQRSNEQNKPVE